MVLGIPQLISILIFISGIINISLALFVRMHFRYPFIEDIFSLPVIHLSRTLILILGVFLIFLAGGLWKRKRRSWQISTIALIASVVLHLIKNFDYKAGLFLSLILLILIVYRNMFIVKSTSFGKANGIKMSFTILTLLFIYSFFGFFALQGQFNNPVTANNISQDYLFSIFGIGRDTLIPITRHGVWFEDSISTVGFASIILIFAAIFAPLIDRNKPSEEDKKSARDLVLIFSGNSSSYFGLMNDKSYFFNKRRTCVIAYKIANNVAIALADPAGSNKDRSSTLTEFIKDMSIRGLSYAFYNVSQEFYHTYKKLGMKFVKIGEEAVLPTDSFDLNTPDLKEVRYGYNRLNKLGYKLNWHKLSDVPWSILHDVDILYSSWLKGKKTSPLTFSLGFYPFPLEDKAYLLTVYSDEGAIRAAFSFFPYKNQQGMVLDLMLRNSNTPNGTVEGALANAIAYFREKGYKEISLGVAPLSNTSSKESYNLMDKGLKFIFENFNQAYDYKHLFDFKQNFKPSWIHKYLAYQNSSEIPKITIALVEAHMLKKGIKPYLIQEI